MTFWEYHTHLAGLGWAGSECKPACDPLVGVESTGEPQAAEGIGGLDGGSHSSRWQDDMKPWTSRQVLLDTDPGLMSH